MCTVAAARAMCAIEPMFELVLEKAEEPEVKLPNPLDHRESKRVPEKKTSISALMTMPKTLTVWITRNCGKLFKR